MTNPGIFYVKEREDIIMSGTVYDKDFWDQRYSTDSYLYGETPNDFLVESQNHLKAGGKILCLSEGEGRNAVYLASRGFQVTCVDQSSVAKEKALKLAAKYNVEIKYDVLDLKDYDLGEEKWDGIVSIFAHTPTSIRRNLHKDVKRALKPGGVFLLEGYNVEQLGYGSGGPKDEDMLCKKEEFEEDFQDLSILMLQNRVRSVQEGEAHSGEASVSQLIVRK